MINGSTLKKLRQQRLLSQEQLAHMSGLSFTTISRLENNKCAVARGNTITSLARALSVPVLTLIDK
jgi:transcriptional regulator with XRE-family HTH domain